MQSSTPKRPASTNRRHFIAAGLLALAFKFPALTAFLPGLGAGIHATVTACPAVTVAVGAVLLLGRGIPRAHGAVTRLAGPFAARLLCGKAVAR